MNRTAELVRQISEKIDLLSAQCADLKKQVKDLRAEKERLENRNGQLSAEYAELESRFEVFRIAMSVARPGNDNTEAKKRIDQLIREIDKCIALVNH